MQMPEKRRMTQPGSVHLLVASKLEEQPSEEAYTSSLRLKRENEEVSTLIVEKSEYARERSRLPRVLFVIHLLRK